MIAVLSSGHHDLSDWLLLIAVILFAVGFVLALANRAIGVLTATTCTLAGLCALALALFVT